MDKQYINIPETLDSLEGDALKYTVEEIHELNRQIHEYLRITPQSMTIIALIATAVATAFIIKSDSLRHGILLIAPIVLAVISIYHFNVANEVAALAEQRDRLSNRVNRALNTPVFVSRLMSDLLRGSRGTQMSVLLVGCIILGVIGLGIINAWNTWWIIPQIIVTILSIITSCITLMDISSTRRQANNALNNIFGTIDMPENAPLTHDNLLQGFTKVPKRSKSLNNKQSK